MKQIIKQAEQQTFAQWKARWRESGIIPGWGEFDGTPIKQIIKETLLAEQGHICCFCESRVKVDHGHIAHLRDRVGHPEQALDYDNLLYSCPENPRKIPQTCGHSQGNRVLPITPLDQDCESRFIYTEVGEIVPRDEDDKDAIQTINMLNLNDRRSGFQRNRGEIFQTIRDYRQKLSESEFDLWMNSELARQADGMFNPFWTTRKYAAEKKQ